MCSFYLHIQDELIALLYIVEQRKILGDYPTLIEIDSIGALLGKWQDGKNDDVKFFIDFKDFLKTVNEITNTYKHSFIIDHMIFFRQLITPMVYASKNASAKNRNKFDNMKNKLIAVPLKDIVNDFNKMFKEYRILLKEMTIEQIIVDFEKKKRN